MARGIFLTMLHDKFAKCINGVFVAIENPLDKDKLLIIEL